MSLDSRYLKGIEHFNKREFFDAHEIWEELWHEEHGEAHKFVQGLIQLATCLHHFEAKNLKGAFLLYQGGVELLSPYKPEYWNLSVEQLLSEMKECLAKVVAYEYDQLPGRFDPNKDNFPVKLEDDQVPKIRLR